MPYVPTEDRPEIDKQVEVLAHEIADFTKGNFKLLEVYKLKMYQIASDLVSGNKQDMQPLSLAIFTAGEKYGYEGAFLGELNYAITRLIQRVPQLKVKNGEFPETSELRYWLYACTVEALTHTAQEFIKEGKGVSGVFEDIKDEYKVRVNQPYEIAQIIKSGDCYDTPFYNKAVPVKTGQGEVIGHVYVNMKRDPKFTNLRTLEGSLVFVPEPTKVGNRQGIPGYMEV